MNRTRLQLGAPWIAKLTVSAACLAAIWLTGQLLRLCLEQYSSNPDFPPTWFWGLTWILGIADVSVIYYIGFKLVRVLLGKSAPWRVLRTVVLLILALGIPYLASTYAFSMIPQRDFTDELFQVRTEPIPGKISAECTDMESNTLDTLQPVKLDEIWSTRHDSSLFYSKFWDRSIVGWKAWIGGIGQNYYQHGTDQYTVSLFLRDPYSQASSISTGTDTDVSGGFSARIEPFIFADVDKLSVGQEVRVCGRLTDTAIMADGKVIVTVSEPVVNPFPLSEAIAVTQIPDDLLVEYEDHGCGSGYVCPEYKLTLDAKGAITYEGYNGAMSVEGTQHAEASREKMRQLVFEIQRAGIFLTDSDNLPAGFTRDSVGSTIITIRMGGTTRTIFRGWQSDVVPRSALMIPAKIQEVARSERWMK
jgi:hypothetical protein